MKTLNGKNIAIFIESDYVYREIHYYADRFTEEGAQVHFITRFWNDSLLTFRNFKDHDYHIELDLESKGFQLKDLTHFFDSGLDQLHAIIVPGGIVADRLRYVEIPGNISPALRLLEQSFGNGRIIKGFICHALWLLSLRPDLIKSRPVTCHNNVVGDVLNMGACYVDADVHQDRDLITARSADYYVVFTKAIINALKDQELCL